MELSIIQQEPRAERFLIPNKKSLQTTCVSKLKKKKRASYELGSHTTKGPNFFPSTAVNKDRKCEYVFGA